MSGIAERLGNVLYWSANIFGILTFLSCIAVALLSYGEGQKDFVPQMFALAFGTVMAGVCHLIGRACRYVLAGR